jgi:hypothetical protein
VTGERRPEPGETCSCGRPAVVVYLAHREIPYCGLPDVAWVADSAAHTEVPDELSMRRKSATPLSNPAVKNLPPRGRNKTADVTGAER